jgi:predicted nucleic acid-binding protein
MKCILFDTGPLISLALNNILWVLKPLKERFEGEFYITEAVKRECVDTPLSSKKFRYEAIQILKLIEDGVIKIFKDTRLDKNTSELIDLANSLYKVHGSFVKIVQYGEIESIAAAMILGAEAVVIDEFITRTLIEDTPSVKDRLEKRLHLPVEADNKNIARFKGIIQGVVVIRSFELVTVAYEADLFKDYYLHLKDPKKTLLEGILWGIKLNGCSVSEEEIDEILNLEKF